jgi:hypothetical protein
MNEPSYIGKMLCSLAMSAFSCFLITSSIGALVPETASNAFQLSVIKAVGGIVAALIGGWLGWTSAQLIITGTIYSTAMNLIMGLFSW